MVHGSINRREDSMSYIDLNPHIRTLLGPGPSNVHPRVLRAMAAPLVGHLDPDFLQVMDEVKQLLQLVFQTENNLTIPLSGTGSAGMEAALYNLIEEGDKVLVAINGYFGERMCQMIPRCGGRIRRIEAQWGDIFRPEQVEEALREGGVKVVAIVHAETSTGVLQPLKEISEIVHRHGALLLVDAVTSLGGVELKVDEWDVDACYSGTQKCLSCPPGLSPITLGPRAEEVLKERQTSVGSWYLDLTLIQRYWGSERTYHHTAPISMNYALREALRLIHEEGLEARFARHRLNQRALVAGLEAMGMQLLVPAEYRLPSLTTVRIPAGVDEAQVRSRLLREFNIEIAGGLGDLRGRIWRIGLMGHSSRRENVFLLLSALDYLLGDVNFSRPAGAATEAAGQVYH
jgi:alanine-glyoxylate transaminase/serine-glyoxylate transaminase/serine-pyruvate transaminase